MNSLKNSYYILHFLYFLNIIILRFSKLDDSSKIDYIKQEEKMLAEPDNKDKEYPLVS